MTIFEEALGGATKKIVKEGKSTWHKCVVIFNEMKTGATDWGKYGNLFKLVILLLSIVFSDDDEEYIFSWVGKKLTHQRERFNFKRHFSEGYSEPSRTSKI